MDFTMAHPNYNFRKYHAYEAFEKRARESKRLIKRIAKGDFFKVAESEHEFLAIMPPRVPTPQEIKQAKVQQNLIKRTLLTKEEESEMDKINFNEHGIIKIKLEADKVMTLEELNYYAILKAGGLPTREELVAAGVNQGDANNFWQPVIKNNGDLDLCQLGNHRISGKRYVLHSEEPENNLPGAWIDNFTPYEYRPLGWMYVKKTSKARAVYKPNHHLETEEAKITRLMRD